MSGGGRNIGTLSTSVTTCGSSAEADDELDLLNLQLAATSSFQQQSASTPNTGRLTTRAADDDHSNTSRQQRSRRSLQENLPSLASPFSTHPRKRQRQRSLMTLWSDRQLLDEMQQAATHRLLAHVDLRWDFNAFTLDRLSDGQNLPTLCTYLFKQHDLISYFRLDVVVAWKFFGLVEGGYHASNPYHNSVHAADVTQAMACFLAEPTIRKYLAPREIMAAIIAAVCHDVDHPGLNEKFLIATSSHLAGLYNNASVLENHHWRSAISMMRESGFANLLRPEDREEIEEIVQKMILATDISRQAEFLALLRQYQDTGEMDLSLRKYRHFFLQIALKCADISNPCRPWKVSRLWSYRACEEFFRQGDRERELGMMPVTQICDRNNITIPKVQSGFYRFVASPLFEEWGRLLSSPLSAAMLHNLTTNQARWDVMCQNETSQDCSAMAASQVSQGSHSSSSGGAGSVAGEESSRRDSIEPNSGASHHRLSRSSADGGDDDSDPCTSYPYMPLDHLATPVHVPSTTTTKALAAASSTLCSRRRHSLPVADSATGFLPKLFTSMLSRTDEISTAATAAISSVPVPPPAPVSSAASFVRHYSLGADRRHRSLSLNQTSTTASHEAHDSGAATAMRATAVAATRRRLFAANRSAIQSAVESVSSSSVTSASSTNGSISSPPPNCGGSRPQTFISDDVMASSPPNYDKNFNNAGEDNTVGESADAMATCIAPEQQPTEGLGGGSSCVDGDSPGTRTSLSNSNAHHRVTFHLTHGRSSESSDKDDFNLDNLERCTQMVASMQHNLNNANNKENMNPSRRGSAPSNLLLNQINAAKIALAAAAQAVAVVSSREGLPPPPAESSGSNINVMDNTTTVSSYRRGSLPADLLSIQLPDDSRSSGTNFNNVPPVVATFGNTSMNCQNGGKLKNAKTRKTVRRRQSLDKMYVVDSKSVKQCESVDMGTTSSQSASDRRPQMLSNYASLKSASFGGVGYCHNCNVANNNYNNVNNSSSSNGNWSQQQWSCSPATGGNGDMGAASNITLTGMTATGSFPNNNRSSSGTSTSYRSRESRRGSAPINHPENLNHPNFSNHGDSVIAVEAAEGTGGKGGDLWLTLSSISSNPKCSQHHLHHQHSHNFSTPSLFVREQQQHHQVQGISRVHELRNTFLAPPPLPPSIPTTTATGAESCSIHQILNCCNTELCGITNTDNRKIHNFSSNIAANVGGVRRGSLPTDFRVFDGFGVVYQ